MKITELSGGVIYIEDAVPLHKEFTRAIEQKDIHIKTNNIIPEWSDWMNGEPIDGVWTPTDRKGLKKQINWDYSVNEENKKWPLISVDKDYSEAHSVAYDIIKMIDEPYKKALEIWSEKTKNPKVEWVTKNYTIERYTTTKGIGAHSDNDHDPHINTFDWTALIYVKNGFSGGDVVFDNLGHRISPKAGSILFFPADEVHTAEPVYGHKTFIFLYIQSKYKFSHAIDEDSYNIVKSIKKTNDFSW
jgi:hypothetical protein